MPIDANLQRYEHRFPGPQALVHWLVPRTNSGRRGQLDAARRAGLEVDCMGGTVVAPRSAIGEDFSELTSVPGVVPDIISALREEAHTGDLAIRRVEVVSPKIGRGQHGQAVLATLAALGGMLLCGAFRFEGYGVAAVAAVFRDVAITAGFFSLFDREIELTVIAALLLTFGLTFIAASSLFRFAGQVSRGFSFALLVGVLVGTYSSLDLRGQPAAAVVAERGDGPKRVARREHGDRPRRPPEMMDPATARDRPLAGKGLACLKILCWRTS